MAGVKELAKRAGVPQESVTDIFNTITEIVDAGERVVIPNVGVFSLKESKARVGRNPFNGESIAIAAKRKLHFKTKHTL